MSLLTFYVKRAELFTRIWILCVFVYFSQDLSNMRKRKYQNPIGFAYKLLAAGVA